MNYAFIIQAGNSKSVVRQIKENNIMVTADTKIDKLLFEAVKSGSLKEVQEIIKQDANINVNIKDGAGWTPLHFASARGYTEIVELLINKKADVNTEAFGSRWTPLWIAKQNDYQNSHYTIIALLAGAGGKTV